MRSINLFRKLRGYFEFQSKNGNFNKFLSDALEEEINIWETQITDGYILTGKAYYIDLKLIYEIAEKNHLEFEITNSRGLLPKIQRIKGIYSIVFGLVIAVLIICVLSQFVWKIEVIGEENFDSNEVISLAEESGIRIGALGKSLDLRYIEQVIMSKASNLSWIGISRKGTSVYIDVRERIAPQKATYNDEPCNIIAFCDGLITEARVYKGKLQVKENTVVKKGDILVSGAYQPGDDANGMVYTHATADIIAECPVKKKFYLPLQATELQRTNNVINRNFLEIGGFEIPLFIATKLGSDYICEVESEPIKVFDYTLPISFVKKKYTQMKENLSDYSENADEIIDKMIENYENEIVNASEIISKEENRFENNGIYTCEIDYVIKMNIAKEEIIFVK